MLTSLRTSARSTRSQEPQIDDGGGDDKPAISTHVPPGQVRGPRRRSMSPPRSLRPPVLLATLSRALARSLPLTRARASHTHARARSPPPSPSPSLALRSCAPLHTALLAGPSPKSGCAPHPPPACRRPGAAGSRIARAGAPSAAGGAHAPHLHAPHLHAHLHDPPKPTVESAAPAGEAALPEEQHHTLSAAQQDSAPPPQPSMPQPSPPQPSPPQRLGGRTSLVGGRKASLADRPSNMPVAVRAARSHLCVPSHPCPASARPIPTQSMLRPRSLAEDASTSVRRPTPSNGGR